jgi:hypothetical protein
MSNDDPQNTADACRTSGGCPICTTLWPLLAILIVAYLLSMLFSPADPYSGLLAFALLAPAMLGSYWLGRRSAKR